MRKIVGASMDSADTLLLGRRTYQEFADYWPDKTAEDDPFADYINNTPKLVVSTTLNSVDWRNTTLITGDVVEKLTKHKQQPGKNLDQRQRPPRQVAAARRPPRRARAHALPGRGGAGKRLFEDSIDEVPLKLMESRPLSNGVLSLTYEPAGN